MELKFPVRIFPKTVRYTSQGHLFRKFWKELSLPHVHRIFRKLKLEFYIERKAPHVLNGLDLTCG